MKTKSGPLSLAACGAKGAREIPMAEFDPWRKVAECERAIELVADPERRVVLSRLRSLWIAIGQKLPSFDWGERTGELAVIDQIHIQLMAVFRGGMH
jgi:hypothetical protein